MAIATHAGSPLDPPRPLSPSQPLPILGPTLLWLTTRLNSSPQAPTRTRSLRQRAVQTIQAAQEREQQLRQAERGATESDRRARPDPPTQKEQSSTRADRYARVCKKCEPTTSGGRPPKPERTHHCSVCATCILKFDHQCVTTVHTYGTDNLRLTCLFAAVRGSRAASACTMSATLPSSSATSRSPVSSPRTGASGRLCAG